jgi:Raf kinase inhibitor-like YbhB/YbcL family protein
MKLESTAFSANGIIPGKYTCDGLNISPPLSWDEPPAEAQSLVLIVEDPDAPGRTFVHWVVYDIPVQVRQMAEAIPRQPTLLDAREVKGGVQGENDFGRLGYGGPCPPSGTHRYIFKLYALDRELGLKPGATKDKAIAAMDGHILATAELMGRYTRH